MSKLCVFILSFYFLRVIDSCGGIGGGGQIYTNPSFNMKFYPPVGWTYPDTTAITNLAYLPGQSLTQSQAQNLANGALTAAILEGLNSIGYPTTGVTVTPAYTAPLVDDCIKSTTGTSPSGTPAGTQFGIVENGAVTKLASIQGAAGVAITPMNCASRAYVTTGQTLAYTPFIQQASVKVDGIVVSEYQANILAAKIAQELSLGSSAQFTEEITIN
ncbi:hypothetical protein FO519_002725 [Halicephalobus sp. NKZ332]|nr:hypothetical protein FO519_002725 [Halicephalobus sp. NKZ332]